MAILKNTGTFSQLPYIEETKCLDETRILGDKTQYTYDCVFKKEDPSIIVKWCRRNFGERGKGWDFYLNRGRVTIEIRDEKYKVMYEMWHI